MGFDFTLGNLGVNVLANDTVFTRVMTQTEKKLLDIQKGMDRFHAAQARTIQAAQNEEVRAANSRMSIFNSIAGGAARLGFRMARSVGTHFLTAISRGNEKLHEIQATFGEVGAAAALAGDAILRMTGKGNLGLIDAAANVRVMGVELKTLATVGSVGALKVLSTLFAGSRGTDAMGSVVQGALDADAEDKAEEERAAANLRRTELHKGYVDAMAAIDAADPYLNKGRVRPSFGPLGDQGNRSREGSIIMRDSRSPVGPGAREDDLSSGPRTRGFFNSGFGGGLTDLKDNRPGGNDDFTGEGSGNRRHWGAADNPIKKTNELLEETIKIHGKVLDEIKKNGSGIRLG